MPPCLLRLPLDVGLALTELSLQLAASNKKNTIDKSLIQSWTVANLILSQNLFGMRSGYVLISVNGNPISLSTELSANERRAASIKRFASNCSNESIVEFIFNENDQTMVFLPLNFF